VAFSPDVHDVNDSPHGHLVAGVLPHAILRYVEGALDRGAAEAILSRVGETKTIEELAERGAWCSMDVVTAIASDASRLTGEANIGRRGGEELFRVYDELGVGDLLAAEGSVTAAMELIVNMSSRITTGRLMTVTDSFDGGVLVEGVYQPGVAEPRLFCDFALGFWAQVPSLFGAHGYGIETQCQTRGDERCVARVSWSEPEVPAGEVEAANDRRDQVFLRYEDLQRMAAELASAADVETVLQLVVERAGSAVLAPRFLLVARIGDDRPFRTYHRGFPDDASAGSVARRLLQGEHESSAVVVDVATARATYGKIAAVYPDGATSTNLDERLMAAYAAHAAAALEAAAAFEQARRDRDTAEALLDFAAAVAAVGTPEDMSNRLAPALLRVANSDIAAVWLWEPDGQQIRLMAVAPDDDHDTLPATLAAEDIPSLAEMALNPRPMVLHVDEVEGVLRDAMITSGSRQIAVVPVLARGTFLGIVVAGFACEVPEDELLMSRLAGVAHQAAAALDNSRLLAHIQHQALHDSLTGLPNRALVEDRAEVALAAAARSDRKVGLLFLDLDRFKNVNDTLGHQAGDDLICQVVDRLHAIIRPADTLARLGGDEFIVLVTDVADGAAVIDVAERLVAALREPFRVSGRRLFISASVGVAIAPDHGADYGALMQHADAAMYDAKARGRNTIAIHDVGPASARHSLPELELETALHTAVTNGELFVVYQPQIDLQTTRVVGVEALVRWQHPERGVIGPDEFIPIAEESGLINEIDRWVRCTAFEQIVAWRDAGLPELRVAINLSSREIVDPDLAEALATDMSKWCVDPASVEIEITDRIVMAEDDLPGILRSLRATGVRLAIDDFGTGSSVLARLQRCQVDTLKIDKSFVQEIRSTGSPGAIVPALVQMAKMLDLDIVAEGVETGQQAGILRKLGCQLAQGYFFSPPVAPSEIESLLAGTSPSLQLDRVARHPAGPNGLLAGSITP
jgi:diguanylate cyclase (GGDEF)-like protein